jgi:hypothetical protein
METTNPSEAAETLLRLHPEGGTLQCRARDPESLTRHTVEQTRAVNPAMGEILGVFGRVCWRRVGHPIRLAHLPEPRNGTGGT